MQKLLSLLVGFGLGFVLSVILVTLFSPVSGKQITSQLKQHYQGAVKAGHDAAVKRRAELEAELKSLREN